MTDRDDTQLLPSDDGVRDALRCLFTEEPGIGFAVVDETGLICFANERSAYLFTEKTPEDCVGKNVVELFGEEWAGSRMEIIQRIKETGRPVISRHIRFGRQIQSTVRMLDLDDVEHCAFLVITVEGEYDPGGSGEFDIVESDIVHLGPLDPLTRRELEVLALVGHGMSTAQIAKVLYRSPRTVERHLDSIRAKLDGANRVQLAEFARTAGLEIEDAAKKRV